MPIDPRIFLVGLVVGTFVGLSGIGGASVLVAILVLALHVKPSLAIGTDLLYSLYSVPTKMFALGLHARYENIRRAGKVVALFADAGTVVIVAFISPSRAGRERARAIAGDAFFEVHVRAGADACERRDPKGHYRKARAGQLSGFTGTSGEYEPPLAPDLVLDTEQLSVGEAVDLLEAFVRERVTVGAAASR